MLLSACSRVKPRMNLCPMSCPPSDDDVDMTCMKEMIPATKNRLKHGSLPNSVLGCSTLRFLPLRCLLAVISYMFWLCITNVHEQEPV